MPYQFTNSMAELAVENGANVIRGLVTKINEENGKVTSVIYTVKRDSSHSESRTLDVTDVLICAGPWSRQLYPFAPIIGLQQHSVILRPPRPLPGYMPFTEMSFPATATKRVQYITSEISTRPNNTIWVASGTGTCYELLGTADDIIPDKEACDEIITNAGAISRALLVADVCEHQPCYLRNIEGGVPGPILGGTDIAGLWIAAGHSCWGIQNGPGTGKIMSEFVFERSAKSADVSGLNIKHLKDDV